MILNTKFLHFILRISNAKKVANRIFLKPSRSRKFNFPNRLKKGLNYHQFTVDDRSVVTFESRNSSSDRHLLFLHGGAYAAEANSSHWRMMEHLIKNTGFKLSFIDYPLAPEHTYKESHEMVFHAYTRLVELHPDDDFYFVGDSAGGGFCLSFAQMLRNVHFKKMPEKMVLLSPWVDISMSNPEIKEWEQKDLLLDPKALLISAKNFAGDLDLKDPVVSPLYGTMENLNRIGIFAGTHEILLPDCRELKRKIEESNSEVYYKEYEGMQHDWMIFPIKEREILLNEVVDYLMN